MILSEAELRRIAGFMKQRYGINLEKKRTLISGRLDVRLTQKGYTSYDEYMNKVEQEPDGEEAQFLINQLTTNHTFFFRENAHFEYMNRIALPYLREKEAAGRDIRIWSAAASTGEEAYSIVMVLKEFFGFDSDKWDTKVLATDISTKALSSAKEGIYSAESVEQLENRLIKRHFTRQKDGNYQINKETRDEVIFATFNLMNPFSFKKKFHIVFLRNVMIYFDEPTKCELIRKVTDYLAPGGFLFVGMTETIDKATPGLQYVQPSIYRKVQ